MEQLRGLYLILNDEVSARLDVLATAALRAGVRLFQYRAKAGVDREALRRLVAAAHAHGALVIVNDDWRAACELADGVHLGQEDAAMLDLPAVRSALGTRLLGISCANAHEIRAAAGAGADYAGVGAVFATASKPDAGEPIGIAGLRDALADAAIPVVAIGGISAQNIGDVARTGAAMAAVISAVAGAPDPQRAAAELIALWERVAV